MEKVFLEPDRTLEERQQHRKLISELKENAEKMPTNYFYIRKGKICSEPKRQAEISPTRPRGPRSPNEAVIMRLKAAGKPIPPELYEKPGRKKQKSLSEESDSDC